MNELILNGCHPTPLAHYLKALGILRLVAEQKEPSVRGCWRRDRFVLFTQLDRESLERFFLEEYEPTPIVGPWNGGSGFYEKDNKKAIDALAETEAGRFSEYRATILAARDVLAGLSISEKATGDEKQMLLEACRAAFPDLALPWLDATFVLSGDGVKFPPLLGTGGNDGRLDFTNNFMQRIVSLLDVGKGSPEPSATGLLRAALFDEATSDLLKGAPIGQFLPNHAGGANAQTGFSADSLINPWDFVLTLEGATIFAATGARRLEQDTAGGLSYPFTVRAASVGYASAAADDESTSRAEIWMPLWGAPATSGEVRSLLAEGRARVGRRPARNGVDFARAVAGLGVDRGIDSFQRFGFHVRNGLSYFAVPVGRFVVRAEEQAALLSEFDQWHEMFRGKANGQTAPAAARRALRGLEAGMFELCAHGDTLRLQQVLLALGACERVMAGSVRWTSESFLSPVQPLSPDWLRQSDDGSVEFRLAAALASVWGYYGTEDGRKKSLALRQHLEPVATWKADGVQRARWEWESSSDVVWSPGHLPDCLNAVLQRRLMLAVQSGAGTYPDTGRLRSSLADVADFIDGRVDEPKLADLVWACSLVDWTRVEQQHLPKQPSRREPVVGALYPLLKLCFTGPQGGGAEADRVIPVVPRIHRAAAAGQGAEAATEAVRRLRGSGFAPAVRSVNVGAAAARRTAAALLFPLSDHDLRTLAVLALRPDKDKPRQEPEATPQ